MSDDRRALDWQRFQGVFANQGESAASGQAVLGVSPDVCPCCDERYVVIAAVHPDGAEISISLTPATALEVAQRIMDSIELVAITPTVVRQ